MPGLGDEFRAAREARHLSLSDVSEQIHIRSVYLQSIEDEHWAAIAAPVYVRGFIRTYARFLGLDGEQAVGRFNAALGDVPPRHAEVVTFSKPGRRGSSPWLYALSAAAAILVAFVAYNFYVLQSAGRSPGAAVVAVASPTPLESPAHTASPVRARPKPAPARTLDVRLTQRSWVSVKIDGTAKLEGIFPPGTRKQFHGKLAIVRTGNAGGVDLSVNGRELGVMGAAGAVVDRSLRLAEE
jgi:cytoskeletal protein RodZ